MINSKINDNKLYFCIKEKEIYKKRKNPRKIELKISINPEFYSIESFELKTNGKHEESSSRLYFIKVEGNNDIKEIFRNLENTINGKDKEIFNPNHPFSI